MITMEWRSCHTSFLDYLNYGYAPSATWGDEVFPEASWGFGWGIHGNKKNLSYEEPLQSPETFAHGGAGGVRLWIDPVYEVVEVFFSVELAEDKVCADLFINSVTAAVVD
jgi:CubicO group peptidase (beta-lactamase class C family)